MAIAYVSSTYGSADFSATLTVPLDAGTEGNRIVLVFASTDRGGTQTIDSATYGGVAMSSEAGFTSSVTNYDGRLFYLVGPATGENDIVVQYSQATNIKTQLIAAVYAGVNQTTPYDAYAEYKGNSTTNVSTTVVSESGDLAIIMQMHYPPRTYTPGDGSTARLDQEVRSGFCDGLIVEESGSALVTIGGTTSGNVEHWGVKLNLNAATSGSGKRALLLGVG